MANHVVVNSEDSNGDITSIGMPAVHTLYLSAALRCAALRLPQPSNSRVWRVQIKDCQQPMAELTEQPEWAATRCRRQRVIAAHFDDISLGHGSAPAAAATERTFTVESFARYFIHDPVRHLHDVTGTRSQRQEPMASSRRRSVRICTTSVVQTWPPKYRDQAWLCPTTGMSTRQWQGD